MKSMREVMEMITCSFEITGHRTQNVLMSPRDRSLCGAAGESTVAKLNAQDLQLQRKMASMSLASSQSQWRPSFLSEENIKHRNSCWQKGLGEHRFSRFPDSEIVGRKMKWLGMDAYHKENAMSISQHFTKHSHTDGAFVTRASLIQFLFCFLAFIWT